MHYLETLGFPEIKTCQPTEEVRWAIILKQRKKAIAHLKNEITKSCYYMPCKKYPCQVQLPKKSSGIF